MIGSLRGVVADQLDDGVLLIEVSGVGYRVVVPARGAAPSVGRPVFLHVHTHVRDDAIVLYGFADRDQRRCFEILIGAHGVGPSLALAILSVHTPAELVGAVAAGNVDALTLVPGVGRKTAARLLVELEARFDVVAAEHPPPSSGSLAEAREALSGLGYSPDEIRHALRLAPEGASTEETVRTALSELVANR